MTFNYTVISGDTLWRIAQRFDTTIGIIKSLNGLTSHVLNIGQILRIPSNEEADTYFQFGTWIPTLQIGNGIIRGQYTDQTGNWTRSGHQIFVNGFFRLNYNEEQVEDAVSRNTTVQEIRIGTMPFEANNGASVFNLMISKNHFIRNSGPRFCEDCSLNIDTEIVSVGARSIWGSPRMRVFANERAMVGSLNNVNRIPIARDLSIQDLQPSTYGTASEIRVSGTYTAFSDLSVTDPINTPPPMTGP